MAIDDMGSRNHDCDLILDQNLYEGYESTYKDTKAILLLGPEYVLLRPEFSEAQLSSKIRHAPIQRIFLNLGGYDPHQYTLQILEYLKDTDYEIDVVMGAGDPDVRVLCDDNPRWSYHENANNIAAMMAKADFAIGAGGTSTWERCALGLPSIVIPVADNQLPTSEYLAQLDVIINLGHISNADLSVIPALLCGESERKLEGMSRKSFDICSVNGVHAVVQAMEEVK